jgi:hypothetical protein
MHSGAPSRRYRTVIAPDNGLLTKRGRTTGHVAAKPSATKETHMPASHRTLFVFPLSMLCALSIACGGSDSTGPAASVIPAGTVQSALTSADIAGSGGVSVTPKAVPEGIFSATIAIHIVNARPSTSYIVQRAPEVGRSLSSDGICQRALGIAPWSSADTPAAAFLSFVLPGETAPVTFTTSATGEGTVTFPFSAATIAAGTKFDVMFRLLNDPAAPTSVFQSTCFTVTVL